MVLEAPCGSRRVKEGLEGSLMVRILPKPTRPFCTLLDPTRTFQASGTSWDLVDPLDFPGPFLSHSEPSGPSLTLPDPSWTLPELWTLLDPPDPSGTL